MDPVSTYRNILKMQLEEIKESAGKDNIIYPLFTLGKPDKRQICKEGYCYTFHNLYDLIGDEEAKDVLEKLIKDKVLIKIGSLDGKDVYTTLHADVVFRVIRGRAMEDGLDQRWVGHYIVELKEVNLPNFKRHKAEELEAILEDYLKKMNIDKTLREKIIKGVISGLKKSDYDSFAEWQMKAIKEILEGDKRFIIVYAPTATGKTIVFFIPSLISLIAYKLSNNNENKVLLVYPRKSLQIQQVGTFLKILYNVNESLKETLGEETFKKLFGKEGLTIAIDKGLEDESPIETQIELAIPCPLNEDWKIVQRRVKSDEFTNLKTFCINSQGREHQLQFFLGMTMTRDDREYILTHDPDIIITNPWTLRYRIKDHRLSLPYLSRTFIILDESHVYLNVDYINLVGALILYRDILENEKGKTPTFILSSATISLKHKEDLGTWLLGIPSNDGSQDIKRDDIKLLDYNQLEPQHEDKGLQVVVTLLPYRLSLETTLQGIIQVLATSTWKNKYQAIIFVDSISETATIAGYIETIFKNRKGAEICDHILKFSCRENEEKALQHADIRRSLDPNETLDDYSWAHLLESLSHSFINKKVKNFLTQISTGLYDKIALHHGALSGEERRKIEHEFTRGDIKILIATSTLELGMNYHNVTFIVQYKEPRTDEAIIQRIGRAGRTPAAYKVALAFYLPLYTPIHLQKLQSKESILTPEVILLPHRSVIDKAFKLEKIEWKIKNNLYQILQEKKRLPLKSLEKYMDNMIKNYLSNSFASPYKKLSVNINLLKKSYEIYREFKEIEKETKELHKQFSALFDGIAKAQQIGKTYYQQKKARKQLERVKNDFKDWINAPIDQLLDLNEKFKGNYVTLDPAVIKEKIQDIITSINQWKSDEPELLFLGNNAYLKLKESDSKILIPPTSINDISNFVDKCKKFADKIENFANSLNEDKMIQLFYALSKAKFIKKSYKSEYIFADSFEWIWFDHLRDDLIEKLQFLIGFATSDSRQSKISLKSI